MRRKKAQTIDEILARLRAEMPRLREEYKVRSLSVFGSYVRGKQRKRSDVDVLVEYEKTPGLIGFVHLQYHLGDILGAKVDLVSRGGLKGEIGARICEEAMPV